MCYRMMDKRSYEERKRLDTTLTMKEKVSTEMMPEVVRSGVQDKAYGRFMARLQRWIAKATKEETTL